MSERDDNILFSEVYEPIHLRWETIPPEPIISTEVQARLSEYDKFRSEEEERAKKARLAEIKRLTELRQNTEQYYNRLVLLQEAQAEQDRKQIEILYQLKKQVSKLVFRANEARRIQRKLGDSILVERITIYIEMIDSSKRELEEIIEGDPLLEKIQKSTYLDNLERKEETKAVVNAIAEDVYFLLANTRGISKPFLRKVVNDCCKYVLTEIIDLNSSNKDRPGKIIQNYLVNTLHKEQTLDKCPQCNQNYLRYSKYCFNCYDERKNQNGRN